MKAIRGFYLILGMSLLVLSQPAAAVKFAVDAHKGTAGEGAGLTIGLTRTLNARIGVSADDISEDFTDDGITYDAEFEADNTYALIDWHPFRGGFRVTAGVYDNSNVLTGRASIVDTTTIGDDETGTVVDGGDVTVNASFSSSSAPYVGIGWGNAVGKGSWLKFSFDIGVIALGDPEVNITVEDLTNGVNTVSANSEDIRQEEQNIEDELDDLELYPVVQVGVSFSF